MGGLGFSSSRRLCPVFAIPVSPRFDVQHLSSFEVSHFLTLLFSIFVFVFPVQKYLYMTLFILVQIWTIFIHDGDMISGHWLEKYINSPAHHTLHHIYFTVNYGQYFTWADSYFDSHRPPRPELDPLIEALKVMRAKGLVDEKGNPIQKKKKE